MGGTFRKQARQTLLIALAVSVLIFSASVFGMLTGWHAFRDLVATIANVCLRVWEAVPGVLHVLLGISAAIGLMTVARGLLSVGKQWRTTADALMSLRRKVGDPPPRLIPLLARHGLTDCVVVFHDANPAAMTLGLFTPRVMISTGLIDALDDDEVEAVLFHEQSHLRNKDPLYLLLARALSTALFYVPAVGALAQRYQAVVELAADEYAIARQGGSLSLASAMVKLLRGAPLVTEAPSGASLADLRLSYLLERDVHLPSVPRQSVFQSAAVTLVIMTPGVALYGLAEALNYAAFVARCMV